MGVIQSTMKEDFDQFKERLNELRSDLNGNQPQFEDHAVADANPLL